MRRTALLVLAWLACGAAAVGAASLAVSRIGDAVTDDRPAPLSAAEVRDELAAAATSSTVPSTTPTTAPTATTAAPVGSTTVPATAGAPTTAPPATPPPTTAPPAETRTYALVGGTATLRFAPTGVTVVAATPNAGFSVETSPEHGNGVRVEFESDEHESRVTGWWDAGPREDVREED